MNYLVVYDITSNKMRLKASKILDDYGQRVQESVFELAELEDHIWEECLARLKEKVKLGKNDSIRVYIICQACKTKISVIGNGPEPMDNPDVYII